MVETALLVINIAAAFNGFLLSGVLAVRGGAMPVRLALAGLIFIISFLLATFVALDTGVVAYNQSLGILTDALALGAGALFFSYVVAVSGRVMTVWPFAPPAAYLVSTVIAGGRMLAPGEIGPIVFAQVAYTVAAGGAYLRARAHLPRPISKRSENRLLPALFVGVTLLHAAQLLRLAYPGSPLLFDLVPLVGASGLIVMLLYGVLGSQTLRVLQSAAPRQRGLDRIRATLLENESHLDPDISLQRAAQAVGMGPRELSRYLNQERGRSFREYINDLRVEYARALLESDSERETSIEAIGLLSGFRSRSSFYQAFKARVGHTPAEFKKQR